MAKSDTTAGEGILNQIIALAEKLRTERDDALDELTAERDSARLQLAELAEWLPPDMAETWAHDLFGQARWRVEKYAVLLREWQATHPTGTGGDGKRLMISEMKVKTL